MTDTADDTRALPEAFYLPDGDGVYRATGAAQGPWDPGAQHGGPPTALLAAAIEEQAGRPELRIARVNVDFLGPIPLGVLGVSVKILRPGRRVQLSEAELTHDGRVVAVARAWQHAVTATADPEQTVPGGAADGPAPELPPQEVRDSALLTGFGYGRALEWRSTEGSMDAPGPSAIWARPRIPLVAGRPATGLDRALLVADSANGASLSLPLDRFLSMPTSLGVSLVRHPDGEWVHMAARTDLSGDGVGLASATLSDESGLLGTVTQPLLIAART